MNAHFQTSERIEEERAKLYQLVDKFGMDHPQVLAQSQALDTFINVYYGIKVHQRDLNS